jgi:hypothetical protein
MKNFLKPGIRFMNLFKYQIKFIIIGTLIIVMSLFSYYSYYKTIRSSISFTSIELNGDLYIKDLHEMIYISGKLEYASLDKLLNIRVNNFVKSQMTVSIEFIVC